MGGRKSIGDDSPMINRRNFLVPVSASVWESATVARRIVRAALPTLSRIGMSKHWPQRIAWSWLASHEAGLLYAKGFYRFLRNAS